MWLKNLNILQICWQLLQGGKGTSLIVGKLWRSQVDTSEQAVHKWIIEKKSYDIPLTTVHFIFQVSFGSHRRFSEPWICDRSCSWRPGGRGQEFLHGVDQGVDYHHIDLDHHQHGQHHHLILLLHSWLSFSSSVVWIEGTSVSAAQNASSDSRSAGGIDDILTMRCCWYNKINY